MLHIQPAHAALACMVAFQTLSSTAAATITGDGYSYRMKGVYDEWQGPTEDSAYEYMVPSEIGQCDSTLEKGRYVDTETGRFSKAAIKGTFFDAVAECARYCATVVDFGSQAEHDFVLGMLPNNRHGFWVGILQQKDGSYNTYRDGSDVLYNTMEKVVDFKKKKRCVFSGPNRGNPSIFVAKKCDDEYPGKRIVCKRDRVASGSCQCTPGVSATTVEPVPVTTAEPGPAPGSSYCSYVSNKDCYASGWPSCCSNKTMTCPETAAECDDAGSTVVPGPAPGSSYCDYVSNDDCYASGWPSCCSNATVTCPETAADCDNGTTVVPGPVTASYCNYRPYKHCYASGWPSCCENATVTCPETAADCDDAGTDSSYCKYAPYPDCYASGWPSCCSNETMTCPETAADCDNGTTVVPGPAPGSSYCSYGSNKDCYANGWPSCCLDETMTCPETAADCDAGEDSRVDFPTTPLVDGLCNGNPDPTEMECQNFNVGACDPFSAHKYFVLKNCPVLCNTCPLISSTTTITTATITTATITTSTTQAACDLVRNGKGGYINYNPIIGNVRGATKHKIDNGKAKFPKALGATASNCAKLCSQHFKPRCTHFAWHQKQSVCLLYKNYDLYGDKELKTVNHDGYTLFLKAKKCLRPGLQEAAIGNYPGGPTIHPQGMVYIEYEAVGNGNLTVYIDIRGLSATGSVRVHEGESCADHSQVGEHHWFDAAQDGLKDPWLTVNFRSDIGAAGIARATEQDSLYTGYGYEKNLGKVVILHDANGGRVGCGVLAKSSMTVEDLDEMGTYDGTN